MDELERSYALGAQLGSGSFATVRRGVDRSDSSAWAIKIVEKKALSPEDAAALKDEVEIMFPLRHPNIVQLRHVYDGSSTVSLVLELMAGGELFDRVVAKAHYTEAEAATATRQVASALEFLHARGIVHRDLKPENLLYASDEPDAQLKLADFGLAKVLSRQRGKLLMTACGTPGYVAPEILEEKGYAEKVDVWSLGVILYVLLCGFPPFYDDNNAKLFELIKRGEFDFPSPYWDGVSESAKDLVRHCLVVLPAYRYSAAEVLRHPWIVSGGISEGSGVAATLNIAEQLKRFNARQKFRDGVRKVQALARFKSLGAMRGKDAPVVLLSSKGVASVRLGEAAASAAVTAPTTRSAARAAEAERAVAGAGAGAAPAALPNYYEPPVPADSTVYGGMKFPGNPPTQQQLYSFSLAQPAPPQQRASLYADQRGLFDLEKF